MQEKLLFVLIRIPCYNVFELRLQQSLVSPLLSNLSTLPSQNRYKDLFTKRGSSSSSLQLTNSHKFTFNYIEWAI